MLEESVALHLVADVPVGVMLSGGLDSSVVTALASQQAEEPLHTFSIGFDVPEHSELQYARLVASRYKTRHHEMIVTHGLAVSMEERIVRMFDEPFADSSATPTLCVSDLARGNVAVALSGEGGDEVFGGYNWYSRWLQVSRFDVLPRWLRASCGSVARRIPEGFKGRWTAQAAALDPVARYVKLTSGFLKEDKKRLLAPTFYNRFRDYDDCWYFRQFWRDDLDPFSRLQYLDMKTYLHDDILTKVDRASMAVSLEARVPLLDHELVAAVLGLPVALRNDGWRLKHLLKRIARDLLPSEIVDRAKRGFSVPLHAWLRSPSARDLAPLFDCNFVFADVIRRGSVRGADLWPFIVMGRWIRSNA
jgi:asparagine synthase (glutamine-hydrolysing)